MRADRGQVSAERCDAVEAQAHAAHRVVDYDISSNADLFFVCTARMITRWVPVERYLIYNGIRNRDVIDTFGTKKLGIETMPPLITRGILIDVAGLKGKEYLDAGYAIQPAELDSALAEQGIQVKKGDTVLVHTGWGRLWKDPGKMLSGEPGLGRACARWAIEHEIVCWGCDQAATDPVPFETEGEALPMHLEMLTKAGIRLIENIYMDEIAKKKVYEFCLFAAPLKIKGGTASPVRLLGLT